MLFYVEALLKQTYISLADPVFCASSVLEHCWVGNNRRVFGMQKLLALSLWRLSATWRTPQMKAS